MTQTNTSVAAAASENTNKTDQSVDQTQSGGSSGGSKCCSDASYAQAAGQESKSEQKAESDADSTQVKPRNINVPIRILSPGDDGDVTQTNASLAAAASLNAKQDRPGRRPDAVRRLEGRLEVLLRRLVHAGGRAGVEERAEGRVGCGLDAVRRVEHQRADSDREQGRRRRRHADERLPRPRPPLHQPVRGAGVRAPSTFAWEKVPKATYYNFQLGG